MSIDMYLDSSSKPSFKCGEFESNNEFKIMMRWKKQLLNLLMMMRLKGKRIRGSHNFLGTVLIPLSTSETLSDLTKQACDNFVSR